MDSLWNDDICFRKKSSLIPKTDCPSHSTLGLPPLFPEVYFELLGQQETKPVCDTEDIDVSPLDSRPLTENELEVQVLGNLPNTQLTLIDQSH